MSSQHDRWLARYRIDRDAVAYCHETTCEHYGEEQAVTYEEEYGQGWVTPETCPYCKRGDLRLEEPPEIEEEDDDGC